MAKLVLKRFKFKLEIIGIGETAEEGWGKALAGYYLNEMQGRTPPPIPDYEVLEEINLGEKP